MVLGMVVAGSASADLIEWTSEWTSPPAEYGWAGKYEKGDDSIAPFLIWGFGVALLWPDTSPSGESLPGDVKEENQEEDDGQPQSGAENSPVSVPEAPLMTLLLFGYSVTALSKRRR